MGCLAAERFPAPLLLSARADGRDIGLALFNGGSSRLSPQTRWLGETGDPARDTIYVEHNGVLLDAGQTHRLAACLRTALPAGWAGRLVLSGCDAQHLAAARLCGVVRLTQSQAAPYVDLRIGAQGENDHQATLSSNTRQQLRRSLRRYGTATLQRAATLGEAMAVFEDLARLHQTSWTARGHKGAFASAFFRRFHTELIAQAFPRGEIELSRISAGDRLIGCLYNFRYGDTVLSYQSGFADRDIHKHDKPGLVCHALAIARARQDGAARYDFLAGDNRTKTSLANASTDLHWFDLVPRWSPRGVIEMLGLRRYVS